MRKFTQFIRSEKETRLDVHCFDLKGREGEKLFEILKNMGFTFCYMESDSLLAFLTGSHSYVKDTMKRLKKYYGFSWPEDPAIIGVSDDEMDKDFKKLGKERKVNKMKKITVTVSKDLFPNEKSYQAFINSEDGWNWHYDITRNLFGYGDDVRDWHNRGDEYLAASEIRDILKTDRPNEYDIFYEPHPLWGQK